MPDSEFEEKYAFFESVNPSTHYVKGETDLGMFVLVPTALKWLDASSGKLVIEEVPLL